MDILCFFNDIPCPRRRGCTPSRFNQCWTWRARRVMNAGSEKEFSMLPKAWTQPNRGFIAVPTARSRFPKRQESRALHHSHCASLSRNLLTTSSTAALLVL